MVTNRVEKFRERSGLSRAEVAARLGVGEYTVRRWERGQQIPDAKKLELAALFGGVSVPYLMGWEDEPDETKAAA